jgi:N-acetylneuraminic acid mutarotase
MIKNPRRLLLSAICGMLCVASLSAQVPSMLNYQGRIAVSGVNFDGTGQFKFALVNTDGTQSFWSNDGTSTAGSEPAAAVSIDVESGIYSVRLGDTALTNMTAVPATVFGNPDVRLRVWFNDGVNGSQLMSPDQRITAVGYAMMANTVQDGAITSAKIANGAVGGTQLAAGAVTSALQAENVSAVAAGGIIGSNDPNNTALLAQGFVRDAGQLVTNDSWTQLPGGDAVAGHTAVWTGTELIFWGGVVPSGTSGGAGPAVTAINRGTKYNPTTGVWTPLSTQGAPQPRFGHSAVWTGTEMIVFGGQTATAGGIGTTLNTGGRYNPATNTWSFLAPLLDASSMPDNRRDHFAFWTGNKMLVWGGSSSSDYFGATNPPNHNMEGKVYDAAANSWSDMAMSPPEVSSGTSAAVWTGTEMILWGGQNSSASPPNAGRYDPATDTWQTLAAIPGDPLLPQSGYSLTWSGTEMILWGGGDGPSLSDAGYRYNPATDTWTTMTTTGAPEARYRHLATWVGSELVIWGGVGPDGPSQTFYTNGGRYNPTTDTWTSIAATGSIAPRQYATGTAVAGQLIVWGGALASEFGTVFKFHKNGGRLTPSTSAWTTLANGSPAPRAGHTSIWTGTELIIWGGTVSTDTNSGIDVTFDDGARFNPATGVWTPLSSTNAPVGRYGHSAVWTGTEMIIFGGQRINASSMNETLNTGARYHPGTDTWTATDTTTAPSARSQHTAVWTGSKMIVWGGTTDGSFMSTNTGSVYDPGTNSWTATTTMGGPMQGSSQHYAFWTGTDMILIGEQGSMGVNHRYNPGTDTWTANASNPGLPFNNLRSTTAAQWTGSEILVSYYQTGPFQIQSYSPVANFWQALTSGSSLSTLSPSSVWTGSEMIVFGMGTSMTPVFQAARYTPTTASWTNINTTGGPTRQMGAAVWTGSEMIVWGGKLGSGPGNETSVHDTGSRYRLPQNYYFYRRP